LKKIKINLDYTGVRAVPGKMQVDIINWMLHLQRYIFALKYCVNKDILDVACGSGYGVSLISSIAKKVEGIDFDKKTIKWAKDNNHFYCPVKFRISNIEKEKINGNFDCIVSFETIEHLKNPEFLLKNIKRSLNNYGCLVFSIPINEPPNKFHKKNYNWESVEKLIKNYFSLHIEWYSQTLEGIFKGKERKAFFAVGVVYKNLPPFLSRVEREFYKTARFLKKKSAERLGIISKSRW
jgi:2-polyprenyl-3-methyl-5-hydroxy-6-metoxy-1,4-benzoquinol methylase